jgi:hypothetical protein
MSALDPQTIVCLELLFTMMLRMVCSVLALRQATAGSVLLTVYCVSQPTNPASPLTP